MVGLDASVLPAPENAAPPSVSTTATHDSKVTVVGSPWPSSTIVETYPTRPNRSRNAAPVLRQTGIEGAVLPMQPLTCVGRAGENNSGCADKSSPPEPLKRQRFRVTTPSPYWCLNSVLPVIRSFL
ncbi:unnamed protein product [Ixodes persulcatus]